MISGIVIIALILIFILIGVKRGIAITLLNIAGVVVTGLLSYYLSNALSEFIYNAFIQQTVNENINQMLTVNGLQYTFDNALSSIPSWLSGIVAFSVNLLGIKIQPSVLEGNSLTTNTQTVLQNAVKNITVGVLEMMCYLLLAIIIFIIIKIIIKKLSKVFKIPVIRNINAFLGGVLGFIEGAVFVFFAVNIFYVCIKNGFPEILNNNLYIGFLFDFLCLLN